jgi:hypothetical protein
LCIKLVIKKKLYYDARSTNHQDVGVISWQFIFILCGAFFGIIKNNRSNLLLYVPYSRIWTCLWKLKILYIIISGCEYLGTSYLLTEKLYWIALKLSVPCITAVSHFSWDKKKWLYWIVFIYLLEWTVKLGGHSSEFDSVLCTYTGCPRRNVPDFGRVFLMLKYTDITQNTYIQRDNGQRSLKLWQLLHTYWLPNTY